MYQLVTVTTNRTPTTARVLFKDLYEWHSESIMTEFTLPVFLPKILIMSWTSSQRCSAQLFAFICRCCRNYPADISRSNPDPKRHGVHGRPSNFDDGASQAVEGRAENDA